MTMGSHQTSIGKDNARFTPPWLWRPLGPFDTDVSAGDPRTYDIGRRNITVAEDCLSFSWLRDEIGRAWCNPPFDSRVVGGFVRRMCEYGMGTLLLHVRTETKWFAPLFAAASARLWVAGRVVFEYWDDTPCRIENPKAKHYGKVANSGAPVVLFAFGFDDADALEAAQIAPELDERGQLLRLPGRIPGTFEAMQYRRFVLIAALEQSEEAKTWRAIVLDWLRHEDGPVAVGDLYRAFAEHPKAKVNPNWKAKLRQTLQRGAGRSLGHDQWVAA